MSTIGKQIIRSLRKFARDLKRGDLSGCRVTRVIRNEDGTYEHRRLKFRGKP